MAAPSLRLDVVRVDASGQTVLAGTAGANETVEVLIDGEVADTLQTGPDGRFASVIVTDISHGPRELRIRATVPVVDLQQVARSPSMATAEPAADMAPASAPLAAKVSGPENRTERSGAQPLDPTRAAAAPDAPDVPLAENAAPDGGAPANEAGQSSPRVRRAMSDAPPAAGTAATPRMDPGPAPEATDTPRAARVSGRADGEARGPGPEPVEGSHPATEPPVAAASLSRPVASRQRPSPAEADDAAPAVQDDAAALSPPDAAPEARPAATAHGGDPPWTSGPAAGAEVDETAGAAGRAVATPGSAALPAGYRFVLSDPVIILPSKSEDTAPTLVRPQGDQLAMLQPGGSDARGVVLDQVTYSEKGSVLLRGRARPGRVVRVYGDGRLIHTARALDTGTWTASAPPASAEALSLLRFDELDGDGAVTSRIEVPFTYSSASPQVVREREVVIQRGDNLWRIAEQTYGDGIRYSLIYGANSDLIRDPDLIYPDQVFTIPELVDAEE